MSVPGPLSLTPHHCCKMADMQRDSAHHHVVLGGWAVQEGAGIHVQGRCADVAIDDANAPTSSRSRLLRWGCMLQGYLGEPQDNRSAPKATQEGIGRPVSQRQCCQPGAFLHHFHTPVMIVQMGWWHLEVADLQTQRTQGTYRPLKLEVVNCHQDAQWPWGPRRTFAAWSLMFDSRSASFLNDIMAFFC